MAQNFASDWVSVYRAKLGLLLKTREELRAYHRVIATEATLLDAPDAFSGTNADLTKEDILGAKAVLDALDANAGLSSAEPLLYKIGGGDALPR